MPILVRNVRQELGASEDALMESVARRLKVPPEALARYAVVRKSIDARRRGQVYYSCNVQLALDDAVAEDRVVRRLHRGDVQMLAPVPAPELRVGTEPAPGRPVVVGFGPAGMFAALLLAEHGYRPLVLERGRDVARRHRDVIEGFYGRHEFDPESNLLYGEGGAGTYSDGKLYTRLNDPRVELVLQTFFRHGAKPGVLIDGKPHVGSDRLPGISRRIRLHLESLGGEVRFGQRVDGLEIEGGRLRAVRVGGERVEAPICVLGTGHSARDTYRLLAACGVTLVPKPYQIGLRIEHPQEMVNRWQYGSAASCGALPPAEYQLVAKGAGPAGDDVFSFCMCPGGTILLTNEASGLLATNGASESRRAGPLANSGLVMTLDGAEHGGDPLAALEFQERWERQAFELTGGSYRLPCRRADDFLAGRGSDGELRLSYPLGGEWAGLKEVVPPAVHDAVARALAVFEERMPGFAGPEAVLTGPETRGSAPVRILRDDHTRESVSATGLYPVGEGAGYAGGIVSSAVDGLKTAESIMSRYAPPK